MLLQNISLYRLVNYSIYNLTYIVYDTSQEITYRLSVVSERLASLVFF